MFARVSKVLTNSSFNFTKIVNYSKIISGPSERLNEVYSEALMNSEIKTVDKAINMGYGLMASHPEMYQSEALGCFYQASDLIEKNSKKFKKVIDIGIKQVNNYDKSKKMKFYAIVD